jgi:predicted CXXCH cytochrome family protein
MRILKMVILLALAVLLVSFGVQAKAKKASIAGSSHDLRPMFMTPSYSLCNYCHIIHKAGPSPVGPGPWLWNHTLSSVASYGVYSSPTFDPLGTDIADLGGATTQSNLCLSCHDGTVALESAYVQVTPGMGPTYVGGPFQIKDLSKTHPVNFTFNTALATAANLQVPNSSSSVDAAGEVPLWAGKMQCGTCHDPHNGAGGPFIRKFPTQATGTFCTYCHL